VKGRLRPGNLWDLLSSARGRAKGNAEGSAPGGAGYLGLKRSGRNWFTGTNTPPTLSSGGNSAIDSITKTPQTALNLIIRPTSERHEKKKKSGFTPNFLAPRLERCWAARQRDISEWARLPGRKRPPPKRRKNSNLINGFSTKPGRIVLYQKGRLWFSAAGGKKRGQGDTS